MPDQESGNDRPDRARTEGRRETTLKDLATHLGLSKTTVSVVLNRSPTSEGIPESTKRRILDAARDLDYRPNFLARSLRTQRSQTVGVLVPELEEPYAAAVMSGIEDHLVQAQYLYLIGAHQSREDLQRRYLELFRGRQVEGMILLASSLTSPPKLPTVSVSGRDLIEGVSSVVIDHDLAAQLALAHLVDLGHRDIAFFKGQPNNADTEDRWRGILAAAKQSEVDVREDLSFQLRTGPEAAKGRTEEAYRNGYEFGRALVERQAEFTALFAFNDVSAIGAMRAFTEAGLGIPQDVSVVGFDDILSAAFHNPGLTTVRQPLREMGETAARMLLERLAGTGEESEVVTVQPSLVVRGSTGPPPASLESTDGS